MKNNDIKTADESLETIESLSDDDLRITQGGCAGCGNPNHRLPPGLSQPQGMMPPPPQPQY